MGSLAQGLPKEERNRRASFSGSTHNLKNRSHLTSLGRRRHDLQVVLYVARDFRYKVFKVFIVWDEATEPLDTALYSDYFNRRILNELVTQNDSLLELAVPIRKPVFEILHMLNKGSEAKNHNYQNTKRVHSHHYSQVEKFNPPTYSQHWSKEIFTSRRLIDQDIVNTHQRSWMLLKDALPTV